MMMKQRLMRKMSNNIVVRNPVVELVVGQKCDRNKKLTGAWWGNVAWVATMANKCGV